MNFRYRAEIEQYLALPVSTTVSQKFQTSFDAATPDFILHFTAGEEAMNPLSILVPANIVEAVQTGWPVVLQTDSLSLGNCSLSFGNEICPVVFHAAANSEILQANLSRIRRSISLFGRSSAVSQTLALPGQSGTPLVGAIELLNAGTTDLCRFSSFIGVGEGLTPSFDDFLAAMLLVDRLYGYNRFVVSEQFFEIAATQTTRQALQQYRFAANGHFSRQFEQFAADLTQRQVSDAELLRLMAWGHSSGTDILCGIWYYFEHQVKIGR